MPTIRPPACVNGRQPQSRSHMICAARCSPSFGEQFETSRVIGCRALMMSPRRRTVRSARRGCRRAPHRASVGGGACVAQRITAMRAAARPPTVPDLGKPARGPRLLGRAAAPQAREVGKCASSNGCSCRSVRAQVGGGGSGCCRCEQTGRYDSAVLQRRRRDSRKACRRAISHQRDSFCDFPATSAKTRCPASCGLHTPASA
jgi:hypothetical protein